VERGHYFADPWSAYPPAKPVPDYLDWNLWRGPISTELPYSDDLAPRRWRAFWETGGGQLADWGCHLLDLLYFAFDLSSPESVLKYALCFLKSKARSPSSARARNCRTSRCRKWPRATIGKTGRITASARRNRCGRRWTSGGGSPSRRCWR